MRDISVLVKKRTKPSTTSKKKLNMSPKNPYSEVCNEVTLVVIEVIASFTGAN
ncbi:MAG: hypothetical protein P4M11_02690 [Candidatus Pacebacteria bacterium]|nr:hypothetical protein [Candidatus Paceibacterota bacterium]